MPRHCGHPVAVLSDGCRTSASQVPPSTLPRQRPAEHLPQRTPTPPAEPRVQASPPQSAVQLSAAAGAGASFAAGGGQVRGCAMRREIEPARAGVSTGWRDQPESSANCPSNTCRLREVVAFECLSSHHAKPNRFASASNKVDGRGCVHKDRTPRPTPFMEPVILRGRSDLARMCTYIHMLMRRNDLGAVARGQRQPLRCPRATRHYYR